MALPMLPAHDHICEANECSNRQLHALNLLTFELHVWPQVLLRHWQIWWSAAMIT